MNMQRGLTLIELLVTVAVVGIMLAVGVPAFQRITEENRQVSTINSLAGGLNLARSEAVKQGRAVTVCASADGIACSGSTDWTNGWIAFTDENRDGLINGNDVLVARNGALGAGVQLRATQFDDNSRLRYLPSGRLETTPDPDGTFVLCDTRTWDATRARVLNINNLGRVALAQDPDNTGVRNDVEGNDVTCP